MFFRVEGLSNGGGVVSSQIFGAVVLVVGLIAVFVYLRREP
jgi:hypothetical protein